MTIFKTYKQARRIVIAIIGFTILIIGITLIVLPGPAFLVIPLGLIILATEFIWAKRLLKHVRKRFNISRNYNFTKRLRQYFKK